MERWALVRAVRRGSTALGVVVLALTSSGAAVAQPTSAVGCYRASRPLGPTGTLVPVERDAPWTSILLRNNGVIMLPLLSERDRQMWEARSEWRMAGDTLVLLVFTGMQGWEAKLIATDSGWIGRARYLSDAIGPPGTTVQAAPITLQRITCSVEWLQLATPPSPIGTIYFAHQVDRSAVLRRDSPLPAGAIRAGAIRASKRGAVVRAVLAQFVVSTEGRVRTETVKILQRDDDALAQRVTAALASLRYTAAEVRGRPVAQLVQERFTFSTR